MYFLSAVLEKTVLLVLAFEVFGFVEEEAKVFSEVKVRKKTQDLWEKARVEVENVIEIFQNVVEKTGVEVDKNVLDLCKEAQV